MTKEYHIAYSAEGYAGGIVELTDEEFEIVSRVLNANNWKYKCVESWAPHVYIEDAKKIFEAVKEDCGYCNRYESCEKRQDFEVAWNCEDWLLDDEEEDEE